MLLLFLWSRCVCIFYVLVLTGFATLQPAEITAVRIGSNLGLFKLLAKKDGSPMNVKQIAEATKADDVLIGTCYLFSS